MAYGMNYGIPQLRRNSIMSGYGYGDSPIGGGYDYQEDPFATVNDPWSNTPDPRMFGNVQTPFSTPAPPPPPTPSSGSAGVGPDPTLASRSKEMFDAIGRVYTPEYTDRDRLRALMDAAPEREPPSFGRALVAGGLSLKAADPIAASESVMMAPHRRNMADWLAKSEPFLKTAELENRGNINERTLAGNVVAAQSQQARVDQQEREARGKQEVAEKRAETDRIYRSALALKAAGYSFNFDGPRIIGTKPDGTTQDFGPSGNMDEYQKETLRGEYGIKRAQALGQAGMDRASLTSAVPVTDADGNVFWIRPPTSGAGTGANPPGSIPPNVKPLTGSAAREETPANAAKRQEQEWTELYYTHPERDLIHKWTTIKNGKVTLKTEPKMGSWLQTDESDARDIAEYNRVVNILYGKGEAPPPRTTVPGASNKGIGPSPQMTIPTVKPPKVQAPELTRSWKDPVTGERKFRDLPPTPESYMDPVRGRQFPGQGHKTDINLPVAPPQGQVMSREQQAAEVQAGRRVIVYRGDTPVGTVTNDPESIQEAIDAGFDVR